MISCIRYLNLGKWDLLGETAEYCRSPAPGRQTNACLYSLGWALHAAAAAERSLYLICSLLLVVLPLCGHLHVSHGLSSSGDTFHAHRFWWVSPNSPCWILFSSSQAILQNSKWGYDTWSGGGLVEERLQAFLWCSLMGLEWENPSSPLHVKLLSIISPYAVSYLLPLPISTMKISPIFQMITRSPILWKIILCLSSTPSFLDSFTSLSRERNLLALLSKAEDAQG